MRKFARPALALSAAGFAMQPAMASAQQCISESQVSDMIVYAVPLALQSVQSKCSAKLARDGFLATEGQAMAEYYAQYKDAAWPGAVEALLVFAGDKDPEVGQMFRTMPKEALQPFVDAIVVQKVAEEIPVKDCGKIERVIEAIAPLEPQDAGKLLAVIMSLADIKEPSVCPVEQRAGQQ